MAPQALIDDGYIDTEEGQSYAAVTRMVLCLVSSLFCFVRFCCVPLVSFGVMCSVIGDDIVMVANPPTHPPRSGLEFQIECLTY